MASQRGRRERRTPRGREEPRRSGSDLLARILVSIPLAVLAIVLIDVGRLAFALFMIAVGALCLVELYRLLHRWRPVGLVGIAATTGMVLAARYGNLRDVVEVMVITVPVLFLVVVALGQGHATTAIASTLLGVYWIGLAVTHGELLRQLPHGKGVVIDVLLGTFIGDTGAYIGGRLFGRRPLAPRISPNKTWEGLVVGMLAAIVAVFLAGTFQSWLTQGNALLLGVVVAVFGPIGDLFESVIKRDAGTKDAGTLFGPHGGILDRGDAALFTIVAGYYVWLAAVH
ncbi:MAG TPA: phosphatidate cytidylyltransferase [Solirubrobacteraceae bacterium]|nr:phosphatidate cytidylyltransferase [Solirubrobacteraceae bacterium]